MGCTPSHLTAMFFLHEEFHSFWFVLLVPGFWASCSVYRIDLIAFNLSSKTYFSVFNQYQGENKAAQDCSWYQVASLVVTLKLQHLLDNKDYYT